MTILRPHLEAKTIANHYIETIADVAEQSHIVGSLRRGMPIIKDIDLVVLPKTYNQLWARLDKQVRLGIIQRGDKWGNLYRNFTYHGCNIELYTCNPNNLGYILWMRTGPEKPSKYIMSYLIKHKSIVRFHEGSAWHVSYDKNHPNFVEKIGYAKLAELSVPNEWDFFELLGLRYIDPESRNLISYGSLNRAVNNPAVDVLKQKYYIDQVKAVSQPRLF